MTEKLTDIEIHERVYSAYLALGTEPGETVRGNTTIEAARRSLMVLMLGLVNAMEKSENINLAIKDQKQPSPSER